MPTLETLLSQLENIRVIDFSIPYSLYVPIDLSVSNTELSKIDVSDSETFEIYIENHLRKTDSKVAFGGYNEVRNLYNQNHLFNDEQSEERNIHIGIDLWVSAGTPVLAALDGKVHSFNFNAGSGNYGPTIILEHEIENHIFHTLYGHLSMESITEIEIGTIFKSGQILATIGDSYVNGGYAPHLHFQIIKKLEHYFGDYPGVSSKNVLNCYLENCPNPNLLLKIK